MGQLSSTRPPAASTDDDTLTYQPIEFDPEDTSGDDEPADNDLLALRDAVRDIVASEGHFELMM